MQFLQLPFNPNPSTVMHIDLNSCFASIEQLADAALRGRPVAVAAYDSPRGCIVAPSIEAKRFGVKTGMRVMDGQRLCPGLVVLPPNPEMYRSVHLKLKKLLSEYTDEATPKSIDEFVLNLEGYPAFRMGMHVVAKEIKGRIREEVGESLTVSIGIAPNRFLAKTAAGLRKPDGLDEINASNYEELYAELRLMDLCGIKQANAVRLQLHKIFTVMDFYNATPERLAAAFQSINGYYWYRRLHGWEIDTVDFGRKSYGNSFALPEPLTKPEDLAPILTKLTEKTSRRMRKGNYACRGVHVAMIYADGSHWHKSISLKRDVFDSRELYKLAFRLVCDSPYRRPVRILAESVYDLQEGGVQQMSLFEDVEKQMRLTEAVDSVNELWGDFVMTPARMMSMGSMMPDRISFGGVKELEEAVLVGHPLCSQID